VRHEPIPWNRSHTVVIGNKMWSRQRQIARNARWEIEPKPPPNGLSDSASAGEVGKRKPPLTTVIRLICPACTHSFEQVTVGLVVFDAGREEFPRSVVVDESALEG
jgi:hypothetical protein